MTENREVELVRLFYEQLWNRQRHDLIAELLDENVSFRGSLGLQLSGHQAFADYLDKVHRALGDYRCTIDDLVAEPQRVFTRMTFSGTHRGELLGYPPGGGEVSWPGAALFTFSGGKVIDLWVVGDTGNLEKQLSGG